MIQGEMAVTAGDTGDVPAVRAAALPSAYEARRAWIEQYFDRTASAAWARLTSDAPVSRIRATVREGRDRMRATLAGWLPADLTGCRILDAGCGPGQLALGLAERGADVVAVDLSVTLTDLARERTAALRGPGRVAFSAGDMLDEAHGTFDYVVAMDSIIHYRPAEAAAALLRLLSRTRRAVLFTHVPWSPLLVVKRAVGRVFPQGDRAPAVEPVRAAELLARLDAAPAFAAWRAGRDRRVHHGFYTSHAMELVRA